jgi:hypothetical protein
MGWRACVLSALLLSGAARADVLTFGIFPTANPSASVSCRIELRSGQINVVEVRGVGMPPKAPYRWPVRRAEETAILHALQALISGDLPGVEVYSARTPAAPYVTITWSSKVNGLRVAGLYLQSGNDLPDVMATLIDTVMPGSGCQSGTS